MKNIFTFRNDVFFIICIFLCALPFAYSEKFGATVTMFFVIWYCLERKGLKEKISDQKSDFNESLKNVKFILNHISFNIIERLSCETISEQKFNEIVNDNNNNLNDLFENLRIMFRSIKTIQHIADSSRTLAIHAPELSYMSNLYFLYDNPIIYDFHKKYEVVEFSDLKKYQEEWLKLFYR